MVATQFARGFGLLAAASAVAALSACGGDAVVKGGGGGAAVLPAEERLFAAPAHVARAELPRWARLNAFFAPTAINRATPGVAAYTDLLSVAERAAVPAVMSAAAGLRPSFAHAPTSYTRPAPYPDVDPDYGALWQEYAESHGSPALISQIEYWATGGVSQSSRREGATVKTGDRVHAEVGWSGDRPTFRVGLRYAEGGRASRFGPANEGAFFREGLPAPGSLTDWTLDSGSSESFTRWTGPGGAHGGAFRASVPGGSLVLLVRTDRTGATDTDWLATGMWWSYTANAPHAAFGVFADGGDPVKHKARLQQLAGTATYAGVAHGVFSYADANDRRNVPIQGRATLAADFGDASAYGTVSGRIHDMKAGRVSLPGLPEIALSGHVVGGWYRSGSFRGGARMTYAGESYDGEWGGQFFGHADFGVTAADAHPTSAAGTFGVAADAGHSFIGTFEAHR